MNERMKKWTITEHLLIIYNDLSNISVNKELTITLPCEFGVNLLKGCVSLGKSEIGFLIQDQMDSLRPKKRKIHFRIIFVTSHEIMLI